MLDPPAPMCASWGHEALPAVASGTVDDGEHSAHLDVPYCLNCTLELVTSGTLTVTRILRPDDFDTAPCPQCAVTGVWPIPPPRTDAATPPRPSALTREPRHRPQP